MEINLNNKPEKLTTAKSSITIDELLALKNFTFELLIVRINGELIKKADYASSNISAGDKVDVIHVFGGG
jgi:thiamine biosynthesis protein ThiS